MENLRNIILTTIFAVTIGGCSSEAEPTLEQIATPTSPKSSPTLVLEMPEITESQYPELVVNTELGVFGGPGWDYESENTVYPGDVLQIVGQQKSCKWLWVDYQGKGGTGHRAWINAENDSITTDAVCGNIPFGTYRPFTGVMVGSSNLEDEGNANFGFFNSLGMTDVEVILQKDGEFFLSAYIRNQEGLSLDYLPVGEYDMYMDSGGQWDGEKFTVMSGNGEKSTSPLVFSEATPRQDIELASYEGIIVPDSEYPFIDYRGDGEVVPQGMEGIDYPITSNGVDFLFTSAYLRRFVTSGDKEIVPESPYNLIAVVRAESNNYTPDFPCGEGYESAIELVYNMPETSRGGSRWVECTSEDGEVIFVFPTYHVATDLAILLPGEPPYVLQVDIDSILDRAEW